MKYIKTYKGFINESESEYSSSSSLIPEELDAKSIEDFLVSTPKEKRNDMISKIFQLVKDRLDGDIVHVLLMFGDENSSRELAKQIFPFVKNKLDCSIVMAILNNTPKKEKYDLIIDMIQLLQDTNKMDDKTMEHIKHHSEMYLSDFEKNKILDLLPKNSGTYKKWW